MNTLISTAYANDYDISLLVIVIISITVVFSLNKINKRYHSNNDNDARRFTATENITN